MRVDKTNYFLSRRSETPVFIRGCGVLRRARLTPPGGRDPRISWRTGWERTNHVLPTAWTGDALTDPAPAAIVPAANMHASGARQS